MMEGYFMSIRTATVFFRYCRRYGITSREDKIAVLDRLAKKMKTMYTNDAETLARNLRDKRN